MRDRKLCFAALPLFVATLVPSLLAQTVPASRSAGTRELYAGYSLLSNSYDSSSRNHGPALNGWAAAATFAGHGHVSIKAEGLGFYGSRYGNQTIAQYFLGGAQYTKRMRKESGFVDALGGLALINKGALNTEGLGPSSHVSVAADAGGGLDTPISKNLSWRVEGALTISHFTANSDQIQGTPIFFGRFSTGIVWRF